MRKCNVRSAPPDPTPANYLLFPSNGHGSQAVGEVQETMLRVLMEVAGYSLQEGFLQSFGCWQKCVVVCIKTG
jgi:hypothetical protein